MALNPLQQQMRESGQVPASAGISAEQAVSDIARLLDDEGRDPNHSEIAEEDQHARGDGSNDSAPGEGRDDFDRELENLDLDRSDDDGGDTSEEEGDDDTTDAATGEDDQADTEDEEGDAITTLVALAEALESPLEEVLGALSHTFQAAGGEVTATLQDLVAGYQLKADYDRDKGELADRRRTFENEQQRRVDAYEQGANILAQQMQLTEQFLLGQLQTPEMQQLRINDQSEFILRRDAVMNQVGALRQQRDAAANAYEQFMSGTRAEFMAAEGQKLREIDPDWNEEKLGHAVNTIRSLGFDDAEVLDVVDSRLIRGATELHNLRAENAELKAQLEKGAKAASKIKSTVPKGLKPGKSNQRRGRGPDRQAISKLRRRLGQTGDVKDAAKLIEELI